jgi:hypothetical protein
MRDFDPADVGSKSKCPVIAKSTRFPVYPQHQTFDGAVGTTVSCQNRS